MKTARATSKTYTVRPHCKPVSLRSQMEIEPQVFCSVSWKCDALPGVQHFLTKAEINIHRNNISIKITFLTQFWM